MELQTLSLLLCAMLNLFCLPLAKERWPFSAISGGSTPWAIMGSWIHFHAHSFLVGLFYMEVDISSFPPSDDIWAFLVGRGMIFQNSPNDLHRRIVPVY
jgi:hypothetical protein